MSIRSTLLAAAAVAAVSAVPAGAVTVLISSSGSQPSTASNTVWTSTYNFVLPADYSNAVLNITSFSADDRAVVSLNGTQIDQTGLYAPDAGLFNYTAGSAAVALNYPLAPGTRDINVLQPFQAGTNVLSFIINDTAWGIYGESRFVEGQVTNYNFTATLTYDTASAAVPEPATWAMMVAGFGLVGFAMRRRETARVSFA